MGEIGRLSYSKEIKYEKDLQECVLCQEPTKPYLPWTPGKLIVASLSGVGVVGLLFAPMAFLSPALRKICLPFIPATPSQLRNVFEALKGRTGGLLDVGSGDGRIVIEASRRGFNASGVELNIWLVWYSAFSAWRKGQPQAKFYKEDLWKFDFSPYDNIIVFGVENMMEPLETKLKQEIGGNCQIFTSRFPLPTWKPLRIIGEGLDTVWVYAHPDHRPTWIDLQTNHATQPSQQFKGLQWTKAALSLNKTRLGSSVREVVGSIPSRGNFFWQ